MLVHRTVRIDMHHKKLHMKAFVMIVVILDMIFNLVVWLAIAWHYPEPFFGSAVFLRQDPSATVSAR